MRKRLAVFVVLALVATAAPQAQTALSARLDIILASEHGATSPRDLLVIRNGTHSLDVQTTRLAVRALGRLEKPAYIVDLQPLLRHSQADVRIEAANAIAQAAQGFDRAKAPLAISLQATQSALVGRLNVEAEPTVRAALCEAIARLPYHAPADVERAESAILGVVASGTAPVGDRLGAANALASLVRTQTTVKPAGDAVIAALRTLVAPDRSRGSAPDFTRDARVRRLALDGLISAKAVTDQIVDATITDPDAQVRRLAMRAIAASSVDVTKANIGLVDTVGNVRLAALRAVRERNADWACDAALAALNDSDMAVALVALDQLALCGNVPRAVAALEGVVADRSEIEHRRGWHRNAHAIVSLAAAAPRRAHDALAIYVESPTWQLRAYAVRAAAQMQDRETMDLLTNDSDDRVANVALGALHRPLRERASDARPAVPPPTAADLKRLGAARAVITIRDVGRVEIALFTSEAPATVLRFAALAESGYYDGLGFDRIAPNAIAEAGVRPEDPARYEGPEIGTWPHVRGAVGIALPDSDDARFFINLVDNPQFDHKYTVFGQVLNGADVVEQILEGDVIDSVSIVP